MRLLFLTALKLSAGSRPIRITTLVSLVHPRLLMRGLSGAKVEIGLATMAYNLKRITNVLGATKVTEALHHA